MKFFAEKVTRARAELDITQDQLAELCGVSRKTIMSYEQGHKEPRMSTLLKLARALKVSTKFLTDDDCTNPMEDIEQDGYIEEARSKYGKSGEMDIKDLLSANAAFFAGGEYPQEDKEAFFEAVMQSYLECKKAASDKFGRKNK